MKKKKPAAKRAKKKAAKKVAKTAKLLKPNELRLERFIQEYAVDLNGKEAAIRAGYEAHSARITASRLLADPDVQVKLKVLLDARAKRTAIEADAVLKRVFAIATADPRELIELRRVCCRYCWGKNNLYQRTPQEMKVHRAEFELKAVSQAKELGIDLAEQLDTFDEEGGIGFDPRKDPNPECVECFGDGDQKILAKDHRDISPQALMLYAGVKVTEKGYEIKVHDQAAMLVKAGEHLGLFKKKLELTGKNGGPVESTSPVLEELLATVAAQENLIGRGASKPK